MGLFDEIEKQAEQEIQQQGGLGNLAGEAENLIQQQGGTENLANEAENAVGGQNSGLGGMIKEGEGLLGDFEGGNRQQR